MKNSNKKMQIMKAAEKLFSSRGFHEITTDAIARKAKVGKGTIYLYFKDKDDLFFQTALSGFDELCGILQDKIPEKADFFQQLLSACRQINLFFQRRLQLTQMMQANGGWTYWHRPEVYKRWLSHRHKLVGAVTSIIEKGIAEGKMRSDVGAEVLAKFLLGLLRTQLRDLGDVPDEMKSLELVVEIFGHGAYRTKNEGQKHPNGQATR